MGDGVKKFLQILGELIGFSSPRAIVFNLSSILLALAVVPTSFLVYSPFQCVFRNIILLLIYEDNCPTSGIFAECKCPGCGLTQGMSELLHGHTRRALEHNILTIPVFIIILSLIAWNGYKMWKK